MKSIDLSSVKCRERKKNHSKAGADEEAHSNVSERQGGKGLAGMTASKCLVFPRGSTWELEQLQLPHSSPA